MRSANESEYDWYLRSLLSPVNGFRCVEHYRSRRRVGPRACEQKILKVVPPTSLQNPVHTARLFRPSVETRDEDPNVSTHIQTGSPTSPYLTSGVPVVDPVLTSLSVHPTRQETPTTRLPWTDSLSPRDANLPPDKTSTTFVHSPVWTPEATPRFPSAQRTPDRFGRERGTPTGSDPLDGWDRTDSGNQHTHRLRRTSDRPHLSGLPEDLDFGLRPVHRTGSPCLDTRCPSRRVTRAGTVQ